MFLLFFIFEPAASASCTPNAVGERKRKGVSWSVNHQSSANATSSLTHTHTQTAGSQLLDLTTVSGSGLSQLVFHSVLPKKKNRLINSSLGMLLSTQFIHCICEDFRGGGSVQRLYLSMSASTALWKYYAVGKSLFFKVQLKQNIYVAALFWMKKGYAAVT